ncbi:MAG: hypothetical protein JNL32_15405 [Candidatus Kapabacteria bacterium]|nr:hypothetical protein [Candidatus Kapabacteria bacterium]
MTRLVIALLFFALPFATMNMKGQQTTPTDGAPKSGEKPAVKSTDKSPDKATSGSAPRSNNQKYKVELNYPAGAAYKYLFTDSTTVRRVYSDSSDLVYNRVVQYYISMKAPKDRANGVEDVLAVIDSTVYSFTSGDKTLNYYSGNEKMRLEFPDLLAHIHAEGREFKITWTPYWEVQSVEGEALDYWRDYVTRNGDGVDTMIKYIFLNAISQNNLANYSDMQKGAFPNNLVRQDSAWKKPYFVRLDGVDCRDDSATSTLSYVSKNTYTVTTELPSLRPSLNSMRLYNINQFCQILGGSGKGSQVITMTRRGEIVNTECVYDFNIRAKARNEEFTQNIKSKYKWKMLGKKEY